MYPNIICSFSVLEFFLNMIKDRNTFSCLIQDTRSKILICDCSTGYWHPSRGDIFIEYNL